MRKKLTILIFARLSDQKLKSKLAPIARLNEVEKIILIRKAAFDQPKVRTYCPPNWLNRSHVLSECYRFFAGLYVCLFRHVDAIMGIYILWHGVLAAWVGKICRKPVIQNIIGDEHLLMQQHCWIEKIILSASIVITRGNVTKQQLIDRGMSAERIFPIPNVFEFTKVSIPLNVQKEFDLIYIGVLSQLKRPDILLNAVHHVKTNYQTIVSLAIIGDGEREAECKSLTEKLGLQRQVRFFGHQSDIYPFLHRSRIFIMTSDHEGFPMVMIEAMACGLPCIMPDVSNIPEVARHNENALLAPVGDVETFAKHIHALVTDNELYRRLSAGAYKIRQEKSVEYSLSAISEKWEMAFRQLGISIK